MINEHLVKLQYQGN